MSVIHSESVKVITQCEWLHENPEGWNRFPPQFFQLLIQTLHVIFLLQVRSLPLIFLLVRFHFAHALPARADEARRCFWVSAQLSGHMFLREPRRLASCFLTAAAPHTQSSDQEVKQKQTMTTSVSWNQAVWVGLLLTVVSFQDQSIYSSFSCFLLWMLVVSLKQFVTKFFTDVETEPEGADITSCLTSAPLKLLLWGESLTGFMEIHSPPF